MVALALLTLAPGRMGGSEGYARGLTSALAEHGTLEYVAVVPPDALGAAGGLPVRAAGVASSRGRALAFARASLAHEALSGARAVHYPLTVPLPPSRRPHAVTLHDVLHLDRPELVPRPIRIVRRCLYDRAARRATRVIVPSAFVRERAVRCLGLDAELVRVVPHGLDHDLFNAGNGEGEREPFLLYPARLWPHKNHQVLFEAFARVRRSRPELELVLTGGGHEGAALPAGVRSAGHVAEAELAQLYRRASALVFPSLYEGFGWPALEAMASGCPVAAGHSVEELVGAAGVLFDPRSPDAVAAGILEALGEAPGLAARGLERAAHFTWERCAAEHERVYAELL